jgi:uncharacterized protein (DUF302 family)
MAEVTAADIAISRIVDIGFDEAIDRVTEHLKSEGFGVLTEIDVRSTLKEKLDVDFRRYRILGACNPPFAHLALKAEPLVGLMMPCNVIVYETDDGKTQVVGFNPEAMLSTFDHPDLPCLAAEIGEKMKRALGKL